MTEGHLLRISVNGRDHAQSVPPNLSLLDFLRDHLGLTGSKECCAVGECGACTVTVNGEIVNACLMLAVEADGADVVTAEAEDDAELKLVQDAFLETGSIQCGFCIPGMLMSARQLLREGQCDETAVREGLSGNLCRCGGYNRMFEAMRRAAQLRDAETEKSDPSPKMVGASAVRSGGRERADGSQKFLADIEIGNVAHLKLVTLPVARARIDAIDVDDAVGMPGVLDIVTAAELPQPIPRFGPVYRDRPVLADGETRFHGEPVAVVAAETKEAAESAAARVRVAYTELSAVCSIDDALAPDAPLVQEPQIRAGDPHARSNILNQRQTAWGTIEGADADLVVEGTYTFPMVTHFAIEPHGFIVDAQPDRLKIWSPVQHPFLLQKIMAELFDLPLSQVHVIAPDPGGAFGGKQNPKFEPLVALVSRRIGRPCRLVLTLEETFQAVRRTATRMRMRTGFTSSGDLVFQDIEADYLIGAYGDIAERVMAKGSYLGCGPYRTPNARINARAILSNTTPATAFRGFGTPQMSWAYESQMDKAARQLGIDGLQIRLRNLARKGDDVVKGDFPADGHWEQSLLKAADLLDWESELPPGRGRGIAVAIKAGATTGLSNSTIRLLADGSIFVYAGTSDMGQGARTIFAQLVADAFAAPMDRISVVMGDTSSVPFDLQTSASRSTVFMGNAISRACEDLHRQVAEMVADIHNVEVDSVVISNGNVHLPSGPLPIHEFIKAELGRWGGELIGTGRMRKPNVKDHPLGGTPAFFEFNCTAFEVSVDRDTGEIEICKHVTVGDVGKALNPLQVEMQDEGAAIMGLGHSIMEHLVLGEHGEIRNLGALDYRIPTTKDMPGSLKTGIVENEDGPGPYGSKGVSEGAILCTAPALAAAVAQATGAEICDLPLTPERVWRALNPPRPQPQV
ncbi:molybdopterin-dependent oxidoreductase [Chelativorans sp. M5D2P16]|uniref:molybdopterin-dependent oxidoreductase n=1 Tax=Chelativorans sp. M5D2P16 TaxID=3095678 RepID=UPI002ACA9FEB|nr:molybdopterin-dependent oxidoreductase [Chelativorans sp. M5D2P16]MDZ5697459.1 molybdopterin-dependent oxidoreductase [Chelativorans sp. M5D2P16]